MLTADPQHIDASHFLGVIEAFEDNYADGVSRIVNALSRAESDPRFEAIDAIRNNVQFIMNRAVQHYHKLAEHDRSGTPMWVSSKF